MQMVGGCMPKFCFNVLGSVRFTEMFGYALKMGVHSVFHLSRSSLDSAKQNEILEARQQESSEK